MEGLQVRAELYSPARFPSKAYELYRTRALVTEAIAEQCWLLTLAITKLHELVGSECDDHQVPLVGIIGGGHMGCAIAMALLKNQYPAKRIQLSTRQPDRIPKCDSLATPSDQTLFDSIDRFCDNARLSKESDVLILCVPPSQLKSVAIQIKHALGVAQSPCVVLSILCGTAAETIQKACGSRLVLRTQIHVHELSQLVSGVDHGDDGVDENPSSNNELLSLQAVSMAAAHLVGNGEYCTYETFEHRPFLEPISNTRLLILTYGALLDLEVQPLMSPLGAVLIELAHRLDRSTSPFHAPETVIRMVLCGHDEATAPFRPMIDDTISATLPVASEDTNSPVNLAEPEEMRIATPTCWRPAWTPKLEQLQLQFRRAAEDALH